MCALGLHLPHLMSQRHVVYAVEPSPTTASLRITCRSKMGGGPRSSSSSSRAASYCNRTPQRGIGQGPRSSRQSSRGWRAACSSSLSLYQAGRPAFLAKAFAYAPAFLAKATFSFCATRCNEVNSKMTWLRRVSRAGEIATPSSRTSSLWA